MNKSEFLEKYKDFPVFCKLFIQFQEEVFRRNKQDEVCLDGSAVLSIFQIRDCKDLDYLYINDDEGFMDTDLIGCHNEYYKEINYPGISKDLIMDNNEFFIFQGIKALNLENIHAFKLWRNEGKDKIDCLKIQLYWNSQNAQNDFQKTIQQYFLKLKIRLEQFCLLIGAYLENKIKLFRIKS